MSKDDTTMDGFRVSRIADTDLVSYGPQSDLRVLVGDASRSTPIRIALQTCQPGYEVPYHCHPYIEYLIVLDGSAAFAIEAGGVQNVELHKGDTVELHPGVWHAFTTSPTEVTRLLGIHLSSERIVNYKPGVKTDARGFRVSEDTDVAETASGA
ncbi:MAG: cupin domain-containing protein [Burkholderiales bacterium]|nr:cupin domain-containing protein [Burkholderiales bacterium]